MKKLNLIILGPPGSGKDTQVQAILKKINAEFISTGDIARELASLDSSLGKKVREKMEKGELLDDNLILEELSKKLEKINKEKGIILDGYPRNISQAEELRKVLFRLGRSVDKVIFLDVPEKELIKRLSTRFICKKCGRSILAGEKKCPFCGGELVKRIDDVSNSRILNRIQVYYEKTELLVEYYEKEGLLVAVDGDQSPKDVTRDIFKALREG